MNSSNYESSEFYHKNIKKPVSPQHRRTLSHPLSTKSTKSTTSTKSTISTTSTKSNKYENEIKVTPLHLENKDNLLQPNFLTKILHSLSYNEQSHNNNNNNNNNNNLDNLDNLDNDEELKQVLLYSEYDA
jgi:hypothetical protein